MKRSRFCVFVAFVGSVLLLGGAGRGRAEVPPLSNTERQRQADLIVEGKVTSVQRRTVAAAFTGGTDHRFSAAVLVRRVRKGAGVRSGQTIAVQYQRAASRPAGWVGPAGQRATLPLRHHVRLFLRRGENGRLELLSPNGWDVPGVDPLRSFPGRAAPRP